MSKTIRGYLNDSLIIECSPIVHILSEEYKSKRCDFCISLNNSLKKCSKCKKMYYCDQNCQRSDWKWHKFECDLYLNYYQSLNTYSIERILLRLLLLIKSDPNSMTKSYDLPNGKTRCLNDLMSHFDEIQKDVERQTEIKTIMNDFESCGIDASLELLTKLFGILVINSFGIIIKDSFKGYLHCGSGLYVSASVLDHSCAPNVFAIANKNCIQIRAKKNIAISDELFICYVETQMPKTKRQSELKSRYYFDCECTRCEFEEKETKLNDKNSYINDMIENEVNFQKSVEYNPNLTFGLLEGLKRRLSLKNSHDFEDQLNDNIAYVKKHVLIAHGEHHYFYHLFRDIVESNGFNI